MGMFNNFGISGSAMNAQSVRLNLVASNLANANSISSSVEETYRARRPVFETIYHNTITGDDTGPEAASVHVKGVIEDQSELHAEYRPNHPLANKEGYVFMPNVNPIEEMTDMISASQSYKDNVEVLNTTKKLLEKTIQMGKGA
ncbi:MAG: flagellar basal body rod protein FlgC [Gammaproteobacteria bacterium]|nr:flagellar basal body rod protein FlgC [Gammaproteobacteria bacterium]